MAKRQRLKGSTTRSPAAQKLCAPDVPPPVPLRQIPLEDRTNPSREMPKPPPEGVDIPAQKWATMNRLQRRAAIRG